MHPESSMPRRRGDLWAVAGLVALAALLFRRHLTGTALFLGNFDRLNTFLNTLLVQVTGWRTHTFGAWDDTMFMGRNTFALPFTYPNVFNYLVSLFPPAKFYWAAGDVSIGFLCASAAAAYWFLRDLCRDRYAAFVGAVLYEFSALSTLKVTQNDMSFAVLIHIPLMLLLLRGVRPGHWSGRFALLAVILSHLFIFCFLQKVAYAMLLAGLYALFLAWRRRSLLPAAVAAAATGVALIASFPRIYGIVRELHELRRLIAPGFDMSNFDALYRWQNYKAYDVLRWFQDGIFGRFYSEKNALGNNLNITEGMLLYLGPLVPFLILGSLVRWRGRWLGLFRTGEREALFFAGMLALAIAVIVSKSVYHLFFLLFLRMDFTHTRIVIAALLPLCGLVALWIGHGRRRAGAPAGGDRLEPLWLALAAGAALIVSVGVETIGNRVGGSAGFALTTSWADFLRQSRALAASVFTGTPFTVPPLGGEFVAWMKTTVVAQVLAYALLAAGGALLLGLRALGGGGSSRLGGLGVLLVGNLLVVDAFRYADFQVNDLHVRTDRPFAGSNSYQPRPDEFSPPTPGELAALHERLQRDSYRTVLLAPNDQTLPLYIAPHLGAFWQLRLIEGYSSGVPLRLGELPWSTETLGLRTMTFVRQPDASLPWRLLAFLNVKYGLYVNLPFYKNEPAAGDVVPATRIVENPFPPVPREFFARRVRSVPTLAQDLATIFPDHTAAPAVDPVATTVVETARPLALPMAAGGDIHADYRGDRIALSFLPAAAARLLVLDELYHSDWHAYAGAKPLAVLPANVVMRAVVVPPGVAQITLQFEPYCSFARLALFLAAALAAGLVLAYFGRRHGPAKWNTPIAEEDPPPLESPAAGSVPAPSPISALLASTRVRRSLQTLAILAVPFVYFLIPLLEGRAWNALGPLPFQILNPPENYAGPIPQVQITAESWGASTVELPFRARLDYCLRNLQLPLWNPYQGLGQPFAGEGEGCPYSPVAILRALLPYEWSNVVTLAFYYLAAMALYAFLRGLAVSRPAAVFGAWAFILSGALTLHLARNNLSDQTCMIPVLFWAAARAIRRDTLSAYLTLAGIACLHLLGGFIQIALPTALVCGGFCCFYAWARRDVQPRWLRSAAAALLFFFLGNGLGGFSLLPLLEAMQTSFSKNPEMLGMLPMPYANAIAIFFPQVFGKYFQSWVPGNYPEIIAWDDLFAFAGTLVAMLVMVGWSSRRGWPDGSRRRLFLFFSLAGVFLVLRYLSFPPVAFVNMLPLLGRQSPKHANEITVFCFVVAAALAVDALRGVWRARTHGWLAALLVMTASCVLTLVIRQGGWAGTNPDMAREPVTSTILVALVLWTMIAIAARARDAEWGMWSLGAMVVAELVLYLPLGIRTDEFLWGRVALFCATLPVALLLARGRWRAALAGFAVGLVFYGAFLIPRSRLPANVDLMRPPRSLVWLKQHAGNDARSWGVQPDLSSLARVQDLGAIGPLAPFAFHDFVKLTADDAIYRNYRLSCYNLLGSYYWSYPMTLYAAYKPIFDAASLRYLYLNKEYFGPGKRDDDSVALRPPAALRVAYEDDRVKILESREAAPKLRFCSRFLVEPSKDAILALLRTTPSLIAGPPMLDGSDPNVPTSPAEDRPVTLQLRSYQPNRVEVQAICAQPGVLELNDVYERGWRVRVDGAERPLLRVNAFFRGVYVPAAGAHAVVFWYDPPGLARGAGLSLLVAAYLLGGIWIAYRARVRGRRGEEIPGMGRSPWFWGAGTVLALVAVGLILLTYFRPG